MKLGETWETERRNRNRRRHIIRGGRPGERRGTERRWSHKRVEAHQIETVKREERERSQREGK